MITTILNGVKFQKRARLSGYVAEMSSAFACASLGTVPTVRHADYIGSWLETLREDSRAVVRTASQASKAADWILSFLPEDNFVAVAAESSMDRNAA